MIRKEPLLRLDVADVSPRIEQMFTDVRKRLLPSLIRDRFKAARSALDQKVFTIAEPPLTEARLMIAEAEKLGVKDDGLGDLSVLVDGFLQLIRSTSNEQQAAPRPAAAAAPRPTATADRRRPRARRCTAASWLHRGRRSVPHLHARRSTARTRVTIEAGRVCAASATGPRVYSLEDEDVSPPVAIDQRMPAMPMEMTLMVKALHTTGVLDVVIDETGAVVDATDPSLGERRLRQRHPASARRWKYQPAMKDGVPVRYVKTIALIP